MPFTEKLDKVVAPPPVSARWMVKYHAFPCFVTGLGVMVGTTLEFGVEPVTVTLTEPLDPLKVVLPPYVALIVLAPAINWLPWTVNVAVALEPLATKAPVPRVVDPRVKLTVPVGAAAPLAGFTVAVRIVLAVELMLVGLAAIVVVLTVEDGLVTVTTAAAVEPLKLELPP